MVRAVFLDRDGVLNVCQVVDGKPYPPSAVESFAVTSLAIEACRKLKDAGFLLVVVTNQPDVGRGTQSIEVVEAMHDILRKELPIDAIYVCTHGRDNECECRKPKPGMLHSAAKELSIDLSRSFMIGDRWRDVNCGQSAGCQTVFIDYQYDEVLRQSPNVTVNDIGQAGDWILSQP